MNDERRARPNHTFIVHPSSFIVPFVTQLTTSVPFPLHLSRNRFPSEQNEGVD